MRIKELGFETLPSGRWLREPRVVMTIHTPYIKVTTSSLSKTPKLPIGNAVTISGLRAVAETNKYTNGRTIKLSYLSSIHKQENSSVSCQPQDNCLWAFWRDISPKQGSDFRRPLSTWDPRGELLFGQSVREMPGIRELWVQLPMSRGRLTVQWDSTELKGGWPCHLSSKAGYFCLYQDNRHKPRLPPVWATSIWENQ